MDEPFKVGMPVVWRGGEDMGTFITYGKITAVNGWPFSGTLECTFGSRVETFLKKDGSHQAGNGYIRLNE